MPAPIRLNLHAVRLDLKDVHQGGRMALKDVRILIVDDELFYRDSLR